MSDTINQQAKLTEKTCFWAAVFATVAAVIGNGDLLLSPSYTTEPALLLFAVDMLVLGLSAINLLVIGNTLRSKGWTANYAFMASSYVKAAKEATACFVAAFLLPLIYIMVDSPASLRMFASAFVLMDLALILLDVVRGLFTLNSGFLAKRI